MNDVLTLAAETSPNAVDWTTVLLALITGLVSITTAIVSVFAARFAANANTSAKAAESQSATTAKAVDGVRAELVAAVEGRAKAEGMLIGQATAPAAAAAATAPRSDPPAT